MKAEDVHQMIQILETALENDEARGMALPKRCNHGMELRDGHPRLGGDGRPLFHSNVCIDITSFGNNAEGWLAVYLCTRCDATIKVPFIQERDKGKKVEVCH